MQEEKQKTLEIEFDLQGFKSVLSADIEICQKVFVEFIESKKLLIHINQIKINLLVTGDEQMRSINLKQRSKDAATDVLSFPMQDDVRNHKIDHIFSELHLGDIVISHDTCMTQAKKNEINFMDEFIHLLCHGFLHLLGFDHEVSDKEDELMRSLESILVSEISKKKRS